MAVTVAGVCAVPGLAACGTSVSEGGAARPVVSTGQAVPSPGKAAASAPTATAPAGKSGAASGTPVDPCALLNPVKAAATLGRPLGAGRRISSGDLEECYYGGAGPLIVAVLKNSFTTDSFQQMIESQNAGPFAETTGKAVAVAGLGDAAYSFDKVGIVEVLKNSVVISITSPRSATSKKLAQAVLPKVS
jgi:hypothetical protein